MSNNSKINTVEKVFMFILVLSADAAEFLATLAIAIPVIGQILPAMAWFYGTAVIMPIIFPEVSVTARLLIFSLLIAFAASFM